MNTEKPVSHYPFENVEGNLFSPVCLSSHWDPTKMLKQYILPGQKIGLPLDPRPLVKVCKQYVTSGPDEPLPRVPDNFVYPVGGERYEYGRYSAAIDKESALRTLDHPLDRWCTERQYIPSLDSTMYHSGSTIPDRKPISNGFISELSMPKALLRKDMSTCRTENDIAYTERSARLFNNPTKQDRYGSEKYYALPGGLPRGEPMPHGGVPRVHPSKQSVTGRQAMASSVLNRGIPPNTDDTSFVGVSTTGQFGRVW
jgi:hypothetical protein